jgi:hypothetical protein
VADSGAESNYGFYLGLYHNAPEKGHHHPKGRPIVRIEVTPTERTCKRLNISISPTKLNAGQIYWVVEGYTRPHRWTSNLSAEWLFDESKSNTMKAMHGFFCSREPCGGSSHSSWRDVSGYRYDPFVAVK